MFYKEQKLDLILLSQREIKLYTNIQRCRLAVLFCCCAREMSCTYLVAMEKWLSVWHNPGGTDEKITAECLSIGQLDVQWPGPY